MQTRDEIIEIISRDRPDISQHEIGIWADYLLQLKGCHLYSAASPEFDKEEWLKQRTAGIGGSEIATLLGENKYSSPRQLWMSKMGMLPGDYKQSEPARWGNLLETSIATEWGIRNEKQWVHIPVIIQSDEEEWLLANIDGFVLSNDRHTITGILEIKTTTVYNLTLWEEGPLPYNYICQTNYYAGITGLSEIDLVCLVGGQKLCSHFMMADVELFEKEKQVAREFWLVNVKGCVEPIATEGDVQCLKDAGFDEELKPIVFEDDGTDNLVKGYVDLREKITKLTEIKKALSAQIMVALDKHTSGITKSHTLAITTQTRKSCDYDLLADMYPDAYKDCISQSVSTILRIK
jgi:putative phage-type endonuclease